MTDQRALAKSKIYQQLTRLLHKNNFNLYRPTIVANEIIVDVECDHRDGRRSTNFQFKVPRSIHSFDYLKFADALGRDVETMMQQGYRPPKSQFEPPPAPHQVVKLVPKPAPLDEPKPALPQPDNRAELLVQVRVPQAHLQAVLDALPSQATLLSATPFKVRGGKAYIPKDKPETVHVLVRTMLSSWEGPIEAAEMVSRVRQQRPGANPAGIYLALSKLTTAGELRREGRGLYARA